MSSFQSMKKRLLFFSFKEIVLLDSITLANSEIFYKATESSRLPELTAAVLCLQLAALPPNLLTHELSAFCYSYKTLFLRVRQSLGFSRTMHFQSLVLGCQLITRELPTIFKKQARTGVDSTVSAPFDQVMLTRGVSLVKDTAKRSNSCPFWQARRIALLDALKFRETYKSLALLLASACTGRL